jgi:hypothetical protein
LFNFYAVDQPGAVSVSGSSAVGDQRDAVSLSDTRSAFIDLFAGRKASVIVTTKRGTTDTWTILRHEQLTVAGKTRDAIVLSQDRVRFSKSLAPFHGSFERWLDAKNGL